MSLTTRNFSWCCNNSSIPRMLRRPRRTLYRKMWLGFETCQLSRSTLSELRTTRRSVTWTTRDTFLIMSILINQKPKEKLDWSHMPLSSRPGATASGFSDCRWHHPYQHGEVACWSWSPNHYFLHTSNHKHEPVHFHGRNSTYIQIIFRETDPIRHV